MVKTFDKTVIVVVFLSRDVGMEGWGQGWE
jgi:hypothetical protein